MSAVRYGGQALIEGVMMRGPRVVVSAVRNPSGQIVTQAEHLHGIIYEKNWAKWPFIRGPLSLWDTLMLGVKALLFSANVAIEEEDQKPTSSVVWGTMVVSLGLAIGVFFAIPALVAGALDQYLASSFLSNLFEKVLRLTLLVGYVWAIGFMPDIRRVFAYHGAEHKAVNALEDGAPLKVTEVQRYSTSHPRCGTSFLLMVVIISFVLFLLLGKPPMVERIVSRIILVPVVAALAYEVIRLGSSYQNNPWVRLLLLPGLAMQSLTTREPDDSQVEVAIVALQEAIAEEERIAEAGAEPILVLAQSQMAVTPFPSGDGSERGSRS